jgi:hypothetical protein
MVMVAIPRTGGMNINCECKVFVSYPCLTGDFFAHAMCSAVGCDVRSYRHQTSHPTSRACTPKRFHVYHVIKHTTSYKDIKFLLQTLANAATQIQGESMIRERLVARVREMGLRCPD